MLIAAKKGMLGENLQKPLVAVDNATLSTLEHTGLYFMVQTMMPANSTTLRRLGIFLATSIAYNAINERAMSSESSGMGR